MHKIERIRGNKLIAEFMGFELEETLQNQWVYAIPGQNGNMEFYFPRELHYHASWNWLMPVVRRIVEVACNEDTTGNLFSSDQYNSILDTVPIAIIDDAWKVVVEFIEFFNEQKP